MEVLVQASAGNGEPVLNGCTAVTAKDVSGNTMQAHLQKLQNFMHAWVVSQEDLLAHVDIVGASPDDVDLKFEEGPPDQFEFWSIPGVRNLGPPSSSRDLVDQAESPRLPPAEGTALGKNDVDADFLKLTLYNESARAPEATAVGNDEKPLHKLSFNTEVSSQSPSKSNSGTLNSPSWNMSQFSTTSKSPTRNPGRKSVASAALGMHHISSILGRDESRGLLERTVEKFAWKKFFEFLSIFIIFCNAIVIGMSTDYAMEHPLNPISTTLSHFELSFIVFYLIEMILRICDKGRLYFTEKGERTWNLFDMILVTNGVWDEIATRLWPLVSPAEAGSLTNLRLFRLLKLVKILRMVRLMRMFKELRLILSAVMGCLISMLWAGLLIVGISYVFAVALVQGCALHLETHGDNIDATTKDDIEEFWSSTAQAILSLYMSSTGGEDWIRVARPLRQVGGFFFALFLSYIGIFVFVVMNIVNSIFIETILAHAARDHGLMVESQMEKKEEYVANLATVFQDMDVNNDGEVTYDEFCQQLYCPRLQAFVASLGMEITDAKKFFEVLSEKGTRSIDIATFVGGCIKLRGPAKSIDLADLVMGNQKAHREQQEAFKNIANLHQIANDRQASDQHILRDIDQLVHVVKQMGSSMTAHPRSLQGYGHPHPLNDCTGDCRCLERSPNDSNEEVPCLDPDVDVVPDPMLAPRSGRPHLETALSL